jgi:hypothetical protein
MSAAVRPGELGGWEKAQIDFAAKKFCSSAAVWVWLRVDFFLRPITPFRL